MHNCIIFESLHDYMNMIYIRLNKLEHAVLSVFVTSISSYIIMGPMFESFSFTCHHRKKVTLIYIHPLCNLT